MSCGAACVRQILLDAGIHVPEAKIRELAGFHPVFGIWADGVASALEKLHAGQRYVATSVDLGSAGLLFRCAPFIALLGKHWVIIDRVEVKLVYVRDPAGLPGSDGAVGVEGVLRREIFDDRWLRGIHQAVFRR